MIWLQLLATLLVLLMGGIVFVFIEDNDMTETLGQSAAGVICATALVLLAVWWPR